MLVSSTQVCHCIGTQRETESDIHQSHQGSLQPEIQGDVWGISRRGADDWWRHYQPHCLLPCHDNRGEILCSMKEQTVNFSQLGQHRLFFSDITLILLPDPEEYAVPRLWNHEGGGMGHLWWNPLHERCRCVQKWWGRNLLEQSWKNIQLLHWL